MLTLGHQDLDAILGGGIWPGAAVVVAGLPGTGKTILAHQAALANATDERPALYYTTWSESLGKLIRAQSGFSFFDELAVGRRLHYHNLPALAGESNDGRAIITEVMRATAERSPSMVVIDSCRALRGLLDPDRLRELLYDLVSTVSHAGAGLLLVGEYEDAEISTAPELAVADGVLHLTNELSGLAGRRALRVTKMRGAAPLPGRHAMQIDNRGVVAFPRLETICPDPVPPATGRVSTGVAGFDELLDGGVPRGDTVLVNGPSGIGKTVLCLAFVAAAVRQGESALVVTLHETADQLVSKAAALGWDDVRDAIAHGRVRIQHVDPIEVDIDALGVRLRDELGAFAPDRVVIDSLDELRQGRGSQEEYVSWLWALTRLLRSSGATTMLTDETFRLGPETRADRGISFMASDLLDLRWVEQADGIVRALSVFKMRNSAHSLSLTGFTIDAGGIRTTGPLGGVTGMLGWSAPRTVG